MNIIIIGATSGIGRALFEKYAADCNRIGIVGRRANLLDELRQEYPDTTVIATADITQQDEIARAIEALRAELKDIDLAIVSSGTGNINATLDYIMERPTISTNVTGWTFVIDTHITSSSVKVMAILLQSLRLGDCAVSRWPLPTVHRKPIKSTIWKPYVRRLSRVVVT